MKDPRFGEIWVVQFEPQVGKEIKKTRPALVLSDLSLNTLPTRIVVPIRGYREEHDGIYFYIHLLPRSSNGLSKESTIDCSQLKSFSKGRFVKKIGRLKYSEVMLVSETVAYCIGMK